MINTKIILKNSSTTKIGEHIPTGFTMSTKSLLKSMKNKHDVYNSKKVFKKEQQESYENAKILIFVKKKVENKYLKNKKYIVKLEIIVIIQGNIEILHLA